MRRVALRRLKLASSGNGTTTEFFDQFIARMGNDEFDPTQALPYNILVKTVDKNRRQNYRFSRTNDFSCI